jgi:23S rRNA (guanosine2251-2'-O)-methyltransferase
MAAFMTDKKSKSAGKDSHYARLRRAHRDAKPPSPEDGRIVLYGLHTVREALLNPRRKPVRLLATRNALPASSSMMRRLPAARRNRRTESHRPAGRRRRGASGRRAGNLPLRPKRLDALGDTQLVLVLDQVTDPHNVGAILRSAVAFDAGALVTTARHSPVESGVLAKAASGALEHIDHIEVRNLAEALETLAKSGFQTVGLDSEGPEVIERTADLGAKIALVLGAEGKGLRQKTRETVSISPASTCRARSNR